MTMLRIDTAAAPHRARRCDGLLFWRGLAILSALTLVAMLLVPAGSRSQPGAPEGEAYGLLFRGADGATGFLAPSLATEVRMAVSGTVQRVTVRQHFVNPSNAWLEGVYVFPLPERSAVDHLVMQIGDRRIVGEIKERSEAHAIYEEAAADGRQASLVSAERPNLFTTAVANIGPGETVVVEIGYQAAVTVENGRYSLRFPMVVAPRYLPADPVARLVGHGHRPDLERVPDAERIDGPVRHPDEGPANPLTLSIDLDAGFPVAELVSRYHPVRVTEGEDGRQRNAQAEGRVPADREFVLDWTPAPGAARAAVFAEARGGDTHLLVTLTPPIAAPRGERRPRDVIFVIDTSGSMAGTSIEQARAALSLAIDRLAPGDRFNVIRFSDETRALFPGLRPWNAETLRQAQAAVGALQAQGGTEMRPALRLALDTERDGTAAGPRLRQVVFLTDAAVGNEAELFDDIAARLGDSRLFTIGIGSAPNSYFMRKAAELGRGSYTYIGDIAEVGERMGEMLARLEAPVLTDIAVAWPAGLAGQAEAFPQPVADLYRGEPVSFAARLPGTLPADLSGSITVTAATAGGGLWQAELPLSGLSESPGVAAIWARAKLEAIEDRQWRDADPQGVRDDAVAHALAYGLVGSYTSLIAVAQEVVRPQGEELVSGEVARNLPEGWIYEAVFGAARSVDPAALPAPDALMQRIALPQSLQTNGQRLPATATSAALQMVAGGAVLLAALGLLLAARRRPAAGSTEGRP